MSTPTVTRARRGAPIRTRLTATLGCVALSGVGLVACGNDTSALSSTLNGGIVAWSVDAGRGRWIAVLFPGS